MVRPRSYACILLQITRDARSVYSMHSDASSHTKRPYERLWICGTGELDAEIAARLRAIDQRLLVSVPCAVPSTKPELNGLER